jgi:hypothetical protein
LMQAGRRGLVQAGGPWAARRARCGAGLGCSGRGCPQRACLNDRQKSTALRGGVPGARAWLNTPPVSDSFAIELGRLRMTWPTCGFF